VELENSAWKFNIVMISGVSLGALCTAVLVSVQRQHMESFFLADDLSLANKIAKKEAT